jgi:TRAP-type C4-dicarboxylate transport system substrate-binding protein
MLGKTLTRLVVLALVMAPRLARAEDKLPPCPKPVTFKIGTLAPPESPWGKVFQAWQKIIAEKFKLRDDYKCEGTKLPLVELTFYWNGTQGDEGAMVSKMKEGQLDGAAITAVGLGLIHRPILALQMPGALTTWEKLDRAREALKAQFEKEVQNAGFILAGWGDIGMAHTMSKGFAIASPKDIKGRKPYVWKDDPVAPVIYQVIGDVRSVPLQVPEVVSNLETGAIDVLTAPALAAEQLQWASRLDHINTSVISPAIGALVFTNKKVEVLRNLEGVENLDKKLTLAPREFFLNTAKIASEALTQRIRQEDAAAFERIKGKMEVSTPDEAQLAEWRETLKQVRVRLSQGTFPPELVKKIEEFAK